MNKAEIVQAKADILDDFFNCIDQLNSQSPSTSAYDLAPMNMLMSNMCNNYNELISTNNITRSPVYNVIDTIENIMNANDGWKEDDSAEHYNMLRDIEECIEKYKG